MSTTPHPPPLRVALLGAGIFARTAHRAALAPHLASGAVTLTAVWSRTPASAAALVAAYVADAAAAAATAPPGSYSPPVALSGNAALDALIRTGTAAAGGTDAVILAVPIPALAGLAARALAAGLHVLSEKPLAHSLDAGRAVLAAGTPAPLYAVAENFRAEPGLLRAAALVAAGAAGPPVAVTLTGHAPAMAPSSPYAATAWRVTPTHRGGVLADGGVHSVAALRSVTGAEVTRVVGAVLSPPAAAAGGGAEAGGGEGDAAPAPDGVAAAVVLAGGTPAAVSLSFAGATRSWRLRVSGRDGAVEAARGARDGAGGYWVRWERTTEGGGGARSFTPSAALTQKWRRGWLPAGGGGECPRRWRAQRRGQTLPSWTRCWWLLRAGRGPTCST